MDCYEPSPCFWIFLLHLLQLICYLVLSSWESMALFLMRRRRRECLTFTFDRLKVRAKNVKAHKVEMCWIIDEVWNQLISFFINLPFMLMLLYLGRIRRHSSNKHFFSNITMQVVRFILPTFFPWNYFNE